MQVSSGKCSLWVYIVSVMIYHVHVPLFLITNKFLWKGQVHPIFIYIGLYINVENLFFLFFYSKLALSRFFSGCWHIMFKMRFHCIYFFQTATVSLLHNWHTDRHQQTEWYLQYIQHILFSANCRWEESRGALGLDWNVPFTSAILQVKTSKGWKLFFFFFFKCEVWKSLS